MHRGFWMGVLIAYLLISFVPQLGLMSLLGKGKGKKGY